MNKTAKLISVDDITLAIARANADSSIFTRGSGIYLCAQALNDILYDLVPDFDSKAFMEDCGFS